MTRGPEGGGSRSNGAITHSSERHTSALKEATNYSKKTKQKEKQYEKQSRRGRAFQAFSLDAGTE